MSLTRQVIFFIPLALILPKFFGIMGLVYTGPISDFLSFVLAIILAKKVFQMMEQKEAWDGED